MLINFAAFTRHKNYFFFTVIFFVLCSCAIAPARPVPPDTKAVIINNVPFYPQDTYRCGPSSLAGVMNFWGINITPEDIAKDIYSGSARGTLNIDMLLYARRKGFDALQYAGNWNDLKAKIDGGYPLIVLVDYGFSLYQVNHFMVVIGYNDDGVIANSGSKERIFIDKDSFITSWNRTNFWTLWLKKQL